MAPISLWTDHMANCVQGSGKVQLMVWQQCVERNIENVVRRFTSHSKPRIKLKFTRYPPTLDNRLPDDKPLATDTRFVFQVKLWISHRI